MLFFNVLILHVIQRSKIDCYDGCEMQARQTLTRERTIWWRENNSLMNFFCVKVLQCRFVSQIITINNQDLFSNPILDPLIN